MVTRLDDQFGRIISPLDSTSLFSKTVTTFFIDHSEYLGDHGLIEKWSSELSNSLTHQPLIIAGAGLLKGRDVEEMTEMVDLVPTVLQFCGIAEHFAHNGKSLLLLSSHLLRTNNMHSAMAAFSSAKSRSWKCNLAI